MHYSHSNIVVILQILPTPPLSTTRTHTHKHRTLSRLGVMKYVHTVYSFINWGCRLRHKRLHKAIPCGYFSRFIFSTWKWTAEFLHLLWLREPLPSLPSRRTKLETGKQSKELQAGKLVSPVHVLCKEVQYYSLVTKGLGGSSKQEEDLTSWPQSIIKEQMKAVWRWASAGLLGWTQWVGSTEIIKARKKDFFFILYHTNHELCQFDIDF